MTKPDTPRPARRGDLIARVAGKEEILLSENSEAMWLDVIRKMDEVHPDLIGYETELERKNAELEEARNFISSVVASVSDVLLVCDRKGDLSQVNPAFLADATTRRGLVGQAVARSIRARGSRTRRGDHRLGPRRERRQRRIALRHGERALGFNGD